MTMMKAMQSERFVLYLEEGELRLRDKTTHLTYDWDEVGEIVALLNKVNKGLGIDKKLIRELYEELESS